MPLLTNEELTWISAQQIGLLHSVQPLKLALSNEVFLLTFADNSKKIIFKRLNQAARDAHDRSSELKVQQLASDRGLTPKVLAYNNKFRLQEYFPGEELSCLAVTIETLKLLALQLQKIHQLPALYAQPQRLAFTLKQLKVKLKTAIDEALFSRILKIAIVLDNSSPKNLLCHGDLSLNNLLINKGKQIKILDWEYATLACAAYDLASCMSINELDSAQQDVLLTQYYALNKDNLTLSLSALRIECGLYLTVFDYLNALWKGCFIAN